MQKEEITVGKRENCFVLKSNNKEFYLSAETKQEQEKWVHMIQDNLTFISRGGVNGVGHSFKKVHFARSAFCAHCESFVWGLGKQGFMCKACHLCIHKKCVFKVGHKCAGLGDTKALETNHNKHVSRHYSNTSPAAPTSSAIVQQVQVTSQHKSSTSKGSKAQLHSYPESLSTDELKMMLKTLEERETKDVLEVGRRYEAMIAEIFDELAQRQKREIAMIEERYELKKFDAGLEIRRREKRQ